MSEVTKEQLRSELTRVRERLAELEAASSDPISPDDTSPPPSIMPDAFQDRPFFLRTLLDTMPSPVFYKDAGGVYLGCNKAFGEFLGLSEEEIVGKTVYDVAPKKLADKYKEMDDALFNEPGVQVYEASVRVSGGATRDVVFYKATFNDASGNVAGLVGVMLDITERKRAEEAMKLVTEATAHATGEDFFKSLTSNLAKVTKARYAFISEFIGGQTARTITFMDGAAFLENMEYNLRVTPCSDIYRKGASCFYPSGIQEKFPEDETLAHLGAQSYCAVPFRNSAGEIIGHFGVMDDKPMTGKEYLVSIVSLFAQRAGAELERNRAEDQLKNFKNAIEQTAEMIVITGLDGKVEYVNPAIERITGYSSEELIGGNPRILKSGKHDADFYKKMWLTIKAGDTWKGWMINRKKSGELYHEEMTITPVFDSGGKVSRFVAIKRDITERMRAEEELRAAKEQAEAATAMKDKFVSLVSHDLRSPLSSISSLLRALNEELFGKLDERQTRLFKSSLDVSDGLIKLIDQLLNITMLQTGKMRPRRRLAPARVICSLAMEGVSYLAGRKGVSMVNDIPKDMRIFADVDLYTQVIQNIVINAVKFCDKGDTVTVFAPEGMGNTVAIKDTGAGISPKMLPNIFRHDVKTTAMGTAGEKGTGLGLPMCRDIMEAHGGALTVESEPGEGSVFYVTLPPAKPIILLVDDQEAVRGVIKKSMGRVEADVVEMENGQEALSYLEDEKPNLILTDIMMPGVNGFELLERVKKNPETRDIPVIVITAVGDANIKDKAFRLGADDFVTKPIVSDDLIPRVKRFVE